MKIIITFNTVILLAVSLFAQEGAPQPTGFGSGTFLPMMLIMFAVIYFMMIRPEQKKAKEKKTMIDEIKKGDKIITISGVHGTIASVKEDTLQLKIADNTVIKINKTAIATVIADKKEEESKK